MKVKLLKKARKRFEIFHLPKGFILYGQHYNYNLFKLTDKENEYRSIYAELVCDMSLAPRYTNNRFYTEADCINYLKFSIIEILRKEGHRGRKDKQINNQHKKVWHI
jgi:hypothetical protein